MLLSKIAITATMLFSTFLSVNNNYSPVNFSESSKVEMIDLMNRLRSKGCQCGRKYMPPVGPLRWNAKLEKAAQVHATDMAQNKFFAHEGSNGSSFGDRATRAGYKWYAVGENIAEGYETFNATLLAWKASPGHCINLMRAGHKEMGVALVGDIWVQEFGASLHSD